VASYVITAFLGEGGMGKVFLARSEPDGRTVALKILSSELAVDDVYRRRFLHETRAAREVQHKYLVPIFDAGEADGFQYMAMRYMPGGSLAELLKTTPPFDTLLPFVAKIAARLDALHQHGLVHRDINPLNILPDRARPAAIT